MMVTLSKTFHALKMSLQDLDKYYNELDHSSPPTIRRLYPLFPHVVVNNEFFSIQVEFQLGTYLLWRVTLVGEKGSQFAAYVKAVRKQQYSLDMHQFLAESGYAPKIFATSESGGWFFVYMECLDNHLMLHHVTAELHDKQEQKSLIAQIKKVIEHLHNSEYVHGDLREGNILVCQLSDHEKFDIKLIDFEWSGKVGSAHYPHFMNHASIEWSDGVGDGKLVTKEHDIDMFERTCRICNL